MAMEPNKITQFLKDMNGWKTVIFIAFAAGLNYAGITNKLNNNHEEFVSYRIEQKERDDKQDRNLEHMQRQIHDDLNRLQDQLINGSRRTQ